MALDDFFNRLVIVSADLLIGYPTIALGGFDARMTQQILDGDDVGVGVEHLSCHGVAQLMAADVDAGILGI